jgi:hypothetical protein
MNKYIIIDSETSDCFIYNNKSQVIEFFLKNTDTGRYLLYKAKEIKKTVNIKIGDDNE